MQGARIKDCPHMRAGEVYGFVCYSPHKAKYKGKCPTRCNKQYKLLDPLEICDFYTGNCGKPKKQRRYRTREEYKKGVSPYDGSINPRTWRRRKKAELEAMSPEERKRYEEYRQYAKQLWEEKRQEITEEEYARKNRNN